ncbi:tail assembly chaperone [Salmonella phage 9NA]|uniref:Putative tail assembly chaperone n=1 Tax=Salmonella phage 9NA TaxID=1113547 RepID=A0A060DBE6_9CAUD|nr:tail assembly chaperone [Salmonella phage 9NA]AIB07051.1 putative tail assembly chaperone [Salmonella phage 9NA]EGC6279331.1 hypothetical protein [Salmonella enterica]
MSNKFNHLKKALSPLVLKASAELILNENFSITVLNLNTANQAYNAAVADYVKQNGKLSENFFEKLWNQEYTQEGVKFVANVLMLDWKLIGEDDKPEPFSIEEAIELLNDDRFGRHIYARVIQFAINSAMFKDDWEKQIEKN